MTLNYVKIDYIIEKINSGNIPGTYWNLDEIKEWIYDALSKINTSKTKIYSKIQIEIIDSKGIIPGYVETLLKVWDNQDRELLQPFANNNITEGTYLINNGFIYVNYESGYVNIEYYSFPIDSEGNPLIPDDNYFISAIIAYIRFKLGERAFFQGKMMQNQFQYLER